MSTAPATESSESKHSVAAGGFGRLARRIVGWTANLLATAIVLVAGLAMGRQVLVWWYETKPAQGVAAIEGQLPPDMPQELRIWTVHGPLSVNRVAGDKNAAIAAMRRGCQHFGVTAPRATPAGPGEQRFVARLAKLAPVEQTEDLNLYVPNEQVTMVVAVSRQDRRIAAWSFGLETEDAVWTCYTFCPAAGGAPSGDKSVKETP